MDTELESRLRRAADHHEIEVVVVRYATAVDTRDWSLLAEVFHDGAEIDYRANGGPLATYPQVIDLLTQAMAPFAASQHLMTNLTIEVQGEDATARVYRSAHMVTLVEDGEVILAEGGFYDLVLRRGSGGWRITRMEARMVWLDGHWPDGVPRPAWYGTSSDRY